MGNPDFFAETPGEYNSAVAMARQIGISEGRLKGKYDPEEKLNLAFYNKAVLDVRRTKFGWHNVFSAPDALNPAGVQLFEDDERKIPMVVDCDCEEENVLRGQKTASTLARVIRKRVGQGVHVMPSGPQYKDQIWIRIMVPGEQRNEVDTMAIILNDPDIPDSCEAMPEAAHNLKFPRHWADYKSRQNKKLDGAALFGTPLRELAKEGIYILKPSQVASFEASGIKTVEQLLGMPDSVGQHFMGFPDIKAQVQAWRDAQAASAPARLESELAKKFDERQKQTDAELEELRALVRNLQPAAAAWSAVQAERAAQAVAQGLASSPAVGDDPKPRGRIGKLVQTP